MGAITMNAIDRDLDRLISCVTNSSMPTAFFAFRITPWDSIECVGLYYADKPRDRRVMNWHAKHSKNWWFEPYYVIL